MLQIYREPRKPGTRAVYDKVERQLARAARELGFPHAYLGIEAMDGAEEVWWLNGYESDEEPQQVTDAYNQNPPLKAAFEELAAQKAPLLLKPVNTFARYRRTPSHTPPWSLGQGRFLTIAVTTDELPPEGTVFESDDGKKFSFVPAGTLQEASTRATSPGLNARIFAVRPYWSKPAEDWIVADPEFWRA